ncbi:MAG: MBL fold metallo-hydrolase [Clostridium thermopalmarium]|uniref:MBL fold metallo-hydrolase n=1 Tax=Clostridium thermopalmarium TaxID=29373 RepID=UPI002354C7FE|nr:MBL fold metallo-hydrolase [Clostridium thermopalmarium]MBE6042785.1 MBL fold metallo-hydrolase [Clostridium thermopalmarium]
MKLNFLGGAAEIGASSILVNIDGKNILLDCGIRQGGNKDPLPDLRTIQDKGGLDAIVLSHAHMDHIGALPIISKEYPNARIYMNNVTKDLVRVLLYDSIKIMNNREAEIPLYSETDVENMLDRVFTINYETTFAILDGIELTFYMAGHIAGASCIYLVSKEGSLFYSGDFSLFSQVSVEGARIPKLRPDLGIFESTYGDKLHGNREIEQERLIEIAEECIAKGGKMLIPAFALGRSQEVILMLKKAMNKGKLKKTKIYVDGMVRNINKVYKQNPLYLKSYLGKKILKGIEPFYDDNIIPIKDKQQREEIIKSKESCIIISSSGMLSGGPSEQYGESIASDENGYIVFTGYQDEESPGRKLLNLIESPEEEKTIELNGKIIPVRAIVKRVGLSAHSDKDEIKALIAALSPRHSFLVHGEEMIISSLAKEIAKDIRTLVYTPKSGDEFDIDIKNPRKQLRKELKYKLNKKEAFEAEFQEELWNFIRQNYGDRAFAIEDIIFIWYGKEGNSKEEIQRFQDILLNSIYFKQDLRRFFMYRVCSLEDVEKELAPKELKQNEVLDLVEKYFKEYDYRKAGLKLDEKKVILNFDFPRAVDKSIYARMEDFTKETSWDIEINERSNTNAAEALIRNIFGAMNIKKISFHLLDDKYIIKADKPAYNLEEICARFKYLTGLDIDFIFDEAGKEDKGCEEEIWVSNSDKKMEQNKALQYIDKFFCDKEFKPYKKSVKLPNSIELCFISPNIGLKYKEDLKELSLQIGWNVSIARSVNQNEVIKTALQLCLQNEIKLRKNPSFNPVNLQVTLKLDMDSVDLDKLNKIKKIFDYNTGCSLNWQ